VNSTYLVDGHNLLYALRPRFAAELVDGHPGTAAREALVAQLVAAFTRPGQVVRVYFDGGEAHAEQRSAQVEVIYPGGKGEQRADHAILAALPQRGQIPSGALVVVTRDIKLAKRARRRGATVIDPAAFFAECDAGLIP
jgi:predicted RNA-binding protein with PIN domain